jgi:hypothetical protein
MLTFFNQTHVLNELNQTDFATKIIALKTIFTWRREELVVNYFSVAVA